MKPLGPFSSNICDNTSPDARKQEKISVTIDPVLHERCRVLVIHGRRKSVSAIIEDALRVLFDSESVADEIQEAYDAWEANG